MFIVAVTGGIASGKSTVCRMFAELGCPVVDADLLAREVVEPLKPAWYQLRERFGSEYFHGDGMVNRERLGELVFADSYQRQLVNCITHPYIFRAIVWRLLRYLLKGEQFVMVELPLFFETRSTLLSYFIDTVIVVYCTEQIQRERFCERTGHDVTAAQQRIDAQMPLVDKCRRATVIIDNMGSIESLQTNVESVYRWLRAKRAHWKIRLIALSLVIITVLRVYVMS